MRSKLLLPLILASAFGCGESGHSTAPGEMENVRLTLATLNSDTVPIPLTDLGTGTYQGFTGGLYSGGANVPPSAHAMRGRLKAQQIQPLDTAGMPSPDGKYVLLSIGMSNVTQEWCAEVGTVCNPWSFSGRAAVDPTINHNTLVIANGAKAAQTADRWDAPSDVNYFRVRDSVLAPAGLTERQVQIVWLGAVRGYPTVAMPNANADAFILLGWLGNVYRALRTRYPNLRQVYVSSRTYAGYANVPLNPEPYAYETGFAFKWLVQAQIDQATTGVIEPLAGDLSPLAGPWLGWAAYLWARDSAHPRSDGFFWRRADFEGDGTHESTSGEAKAATLLLRFFKRSPQARCWFLAGLTC